MCPFLFLLHRPGLSLDEVAAAAEMILGGCEEVTSHRPRRSRRRRRKGGRGRGRKAASVDEEDIEGVCVDQRISYAFISHFAVGVGCCAARCMGRCKLAFVPFIFLFHLFLPHSDEAYNSDKQIGDEGEESTDFSLADSGYSGSNSPQLSHESRYFFWSSSGKICRDLYCMCVCV